MSESFGEIIIDRYDTRLHYISHGLTLNFSDLATELVSEVEKHIIQAENDCNYFYTLNTDDRSALIKLFQNYGYKLYQALIAAEFREELYRYQSITIHDNSGVNYHWDLLFDGVKFISNYIPVCRGFNPMELGSGDAIDLSQVSFSFIQGIYPENQERLTNPRLNLISSCAKAESRNTSLGLLTRKALHECLANPRSNILVISAYCDDRSIYTYEPSKNEFDLVNFNNFASQLSDAKKKGLHGIIFQLWDVNTNQPSKQTAWLAKASLNFAIAVSGTTWPGVTKTFLGLFQAELANQPLAAKAHLKALARTTIFDQLPFNLNFKLYLNGNRRYLLHTKKNSQSTPVLKKPQQREFFNLTFDGYTAAIASNILGEKVNRLQILNSKDEAHFESSKSFIELVKPQNLTVEELIMPYNNNFLVSFENSNYFSNELLSSLWDSLLSTKTKGDSSSAKFLFILGRAPSSKLYHLWLSSKAEAGYIIVLFDQTRAADFKQITAAFSSDAYFSQIPNWQSLKGSNLFFKHWVKLLNYWLNQGLGKVEQVVSVEQLLASSLSSSEMQVVLTLFLFKTPIDTNLLVRSSDDKIAHSDIDKLILLGLVLQDTAGKSTMLHSSFQQYLTSSNYFNASQMLAHAKKLSSYSWLEEEPIAIENYFPAINNLSEYLAFRGEYQIAITLILNASKGLNSIVGFEVSHMLLWFFRILHWIEHLTDQSYSNWVYLLWQNLLKPISTLLSDDDYEVAVSFSIEAFSAKGEHEGYAIAIAEQARMKYRRKNHDVFKALIDEALKIGALESNYLYDEVFLIALSELALSEDFALFEALASQYQSKFNLKALANIQKKDILVLDLAYLINQKSNSAAVNPEELQLMIKRLLSYPASFPTRLEIKVLKELVTINESDHQVQVQILQRLKYNAARLKDSGLANYANELLIQGYMQRSELEPAVEILQEQFNKAWEQDDKEEIAKNADSLALVYYRLGNNKLNAHYYSIAKSQV